MSQYKVRNWSQYNESLKKRGSLSLWISEDAIKKWRASKDSKRIGAPRQYSDDAILCMMMIKSVYHLPYRQLIGFLTCILAHMQLILKIPHFTTVAERARSLGASFKKLSRSCPTNLVLDSTGFKVYGEGEWTVRKHGKQKRRRWKKFHIGICPRTHEIIVAEVTELETADCVVGPKLIKKAPQSVQKVVGDGAYDTSECYKVAYQNGQVLLVPPRQGAVVSNGKSPWMKNRDDAICQIIGLGNTEEAIKLWKIMTGYHERSLVETTISRFKGIFGPKLYSKNADNQRVELLVKAHAMNRMTRTGMPKGQMI